MLTRATHTNPKLTLVVCSLAVILLLTVICYLLDATLAPVQVTAIRGLTGDCYTNNEGCFAHNFSMLSSVIFCGLMSVIPALMVADQKGLL